MIGGYLGYWIGIFAGKWWGHDESVASTAMVTHGRVRRFRRHL